MEQAISSKMGMPISGVLDRSEPNVLQPLDRINLAINIMGGQTPVKQPDTILVRFFVILTGKRLIWHLGSVVVVALVFTIRLR